jgi:hypothetical protein
MSTVGESWLVQTHRKIFLVNFCVAKLNGDNIKERSNILFS